MAEPCPKRQKKLSGKPTWTITFQDASSFRSVVEAVGAIMSRVVFKVVREGDAGWFLTSDGADAAVTCFLSTRLKLDDVHVDSDDTEFSFCIECKHVSNAVDTAPGMSVILQYYQADEKIKITVKDSDNPSYEDGAILNTFMEAETGDKLDNLQHEQVLEIELNKLREMIKKARKARAELLRIQIFLKTVGASELSCVVFSVGGDQYHEQKYCHETSKSPDGSLVVRAAPDGSHEMFDDDDVEPIFDSVFQLTHIEAFVKNIPCKMIAANVSQGVPMMMEYKLNGEGSDSHIRFLIASLTEDDS